MLPLPAISALPPQSMPPACQWTRQNWRQTQAAFSRLFIQSSASDLLGFVEAVQNQEGWKKFRKQGGVAKRICSMTRHLNWHLVCCCSRRRAPKAPAQEANAFAVPWPSGPSALAFPEFEYVLRARAATEQAQLRGSRERGECLWRDAQGGAEEQQLSAFQAEDTDQPLPEEADYDGRSIFIITCCFCR